MLETTKKSKKKIVIDNNNVIKLENKLFWKLVLSSNEKIETKIIQLFLKNK